MFTLLATNLAESGPLTWEMAKQIIQTQSNLAMVAITVLVGLAVLLVAGSWIRDIFIRKRQIEKAIESLRSEMFSERKKDFARLKKENTDEANKMKQEIEKNLSRQLILFEADKARLFAYVNEKNNWWAEAAAWWADALVGGAKYKANFILRIAVDNLRRTLEECEKRKVLFNKNQRERIKQCLSYIPEILGEEKEKIEDKFNKLFG